MLHSKDNFHGLLKTSAKVFSLRRFVVCGILVYAQAVGASVRVFELLDRHSTVTDGNLQLDTLKGEIRFDDVMFNYPSRPDNVVLKVCMLVFVCVCVCVCVIVCVCLLYMCVLCCVASVRQMKNLNSKLVGCIIYGPPRRGGGTGRSIRRRQVHNSESY